MKKMLISLVIEANEEDLHEIKGKVIEMASNAIVSCSVDVIPEPKQVIEIPKFLQTGNCADNPATPRQRPPRSSP